MSYAELEKYVANISAVDVERLVAFLKEGWPHFNVGEDQYATTDVAAFLIHALTAQRAA